MAKEINLLPVDVYDRPTPAANGSSSVCGSLRDHGPHETREHLDCRGNASAVTRLRAQLQDDRWTPGDPPPEPITQAIAVAEMERYRRLYPTVPPEVVAIELIRRTNGNERHDILLALDTVLRNVEAGRG